MKNALLGRSRLALSGRLSGMAANGCVSGPA